MLVAKILHFLGLALGLGCGTAVVVAMAMNRSEPMRVAPLVKRLGLISFSALILLWISGYWLWNEIYPGGAPALFAWKIGFVLVLSGASLLLQCFSLLGPNAASPALRLWVAVAANASALIALILAAMAFN